MSLSFSQTRLVIPDRVITRDVDGTTVILDIDTGRSFTLDEIGTRAWTALTSAASMQEAFDALLVEYRVEPEQLRHDLETLVEQLAANHLLEIQSAR